MKQVAAVGAPLNVEWAASQVRSPVWLLPSLVHAGCCVLGAGHRGLPAPGVRLTLLSRSAASRRLARRHVGTEVVAARLRVRRLTRADHPRPHQGRSSSPRYGHSTLTQPRGRGPGTYRRQAALRLPHRCHEVSRVPNQHRSAAGRCPPRLDSKPGGSVLVGSNPTPSAL